MRDNARYGPCGSRMFRWKRSAATLKERPAAIPLIRPLAPQRVLERLDGDQTVQRRFASEETGLAPMLIVGHATSAATPAFDSVL